MYIKVWKAMLFFGGVGWGISVLNSSFLTDINSFLYVEGTIVKVENTCI